MLEMTPQEWSNYKRLSELCYSDLRYARQFLSGAPVPENLPISSEQEARDAIWYLINQPLDEEEKFNTNRYILEFSRHYAVPTEYLMDQDKKLFYNDKRLGIWNEISRKRVRLESYQLSLSPNLRYVPIAFELSDGCKHNCPFCGVSAPLWKADFLYTAENQKLWREILKATKEIIGNIAVRGACYFGTEPLDNPDYEKFLEDYREILGDFPQTTTVVADRYPTRIRELMKQMGERLQTAAIRFTVTSLAQRDRLFKIYSPQELVDVEILFNNPESVSGYSLSGRARNKKLPEGKRGMNYSISCISGYRVNMARRTVTLTEPERPNDKYPDGLHNYATAHFETAEDFENVLRELSAKYIYDDLPEDVPIFFNPCMQFEREGNIIKFIADCRYSHMSGDRYFFEALELLKTPLTFNEICRKIHISEFVAENLHQKLQNLYRRGYIRYAL